MAADGQRANENRTLYQFELLAMLLVGGLASPDWRSRCHRGHRGQGAPAGLCFTLKNTVASMTRKVYMEHLSTAAWPQRSGRRGWPVEI